MLAIVPAGLYVGLGAVRRASGQDELDMAAEGDIVRRFGTPELGGSATFEFIYRGAQAGEKGVLFSLEETEERLLATSQGLGWSLAQEIERRTVEIVFIPQPNIMVEKHLLMMRERVEALGARRVAVDSLSVFLHKITDAQIAREKTFPVASIAQNAQAVGFLTTDIPYGSNRISRFGPDGIRVFPRYAAEARAERRRVRGRKRAVRKRRR
jgi:KaiC/GvpD/RAD55 family RecA-like ATPase